MPSVQWIAALVVVLVSSTTAGERAPAEAATGSRRSAAVAVVQASTPGLPASSSAAAEWSWPLPSRRIVEPFVAPPHRYGAGHRGIDIAVDGATEVVAPAAGVVAFAGRVVDRGVVTIDHGDGVVSTLEPVTPAVSSGEPVARGAVIGAVATGGHAAAEAVHLGARRGGDYINPLVLLGGVPRAILYPCC